MLAFQWPSFFPADCPPSEAEPSTGTVFRLVAHDPPTPGDFIPLSQERPARNFGKKYCQSCGLSVFGNMEDALRLQRRVRGHRNKKIARGILSPDMGVIKDTPSREPSHKTWWLRDGLEPSPHFGVIPDGRE